MKRLVLILVLLLSLVDSIGSVRSQDGNEHPVITPENAAQVQQLAMLGRGAMTGVAWSPQGDVLAVGSTVGVWLYTVNDLNADPGFIATPGQRVDALAFSPDGRYLVSGHADWHTRVWEVATRQLVTTLDFLWVDQISNIAFSPSGNLLAVADYSHRVGLFETNSWTARNQLTGGNVVAFSRDGQKLAIGGLDKVYIWRTEDALAIDVNAGEPVVTPVRSLILRSPMEGNPLTPYLIDMIFDPTGSILFVSGSHSSEVGVVQAWDTTTGEFLAHFKGHLYGVNGLAVTQDGSTLISVGFDVRLWDVKRGITQVYRSQNEALAVLPATNPQRYFGAERRVLAVSLSPDNRHFATISADNYLQIWDIETGDYSEHKFSGSKLTDLTFMEDGSWLLTYGGGGYFGLDGSIVVWDTETWLAVYTAFFGREDDWITSFLGASVNGKNNLLVYPLFRQRANVADEHIIENYLKVVDLTTGKEIATLSPVSEDVAFSFPTFTPDGAMLLMLEGPHLLGLDVQTLLESEVIDPNDAVFHVNLRISSAWYEIGQTGNDLLILNDNQLEWRRLPDGELVNSMGVSWDREFTACFGSESLLAAGMEERGNIITVVDMKSAEARELPVSRGERSNLVFGADCSLLAFGSPGSGYRDGGSVHLWDVNNNKNLATFAPEHTFDAAGIQFSPSGMLLAFSNIADGLISERFATLRLWDIETRTELGVLQGTGPISRIWFSPDGRFIATADSYEGDGVIRIWGIP